MEHGENGLEMEAWMEEANQSLGEPLQEYFGSIGVKTMQDFTLLTVSAFVQRQLASALTPVSTAQEADINAIPGLDKFAKGRLMRGLQSIVPNFLVEPYHNPKPAPVVRLQLAPKRKPAPNYVEGCVYKL